MLSLDFHAHIEPSINPGRLRDLNACVVAVTRSLSEFELVSDRRDESVTWGVGVHPSIPASHEEFTPDQFRTLLKTAPVVGEIGLDRRSPVGLTTQLSTLEAVLVVASTRPRILNVHSTGATRILLDVLERYRPKGVVLHWWRGTIGETERALDLGCSFSINSDEIARPKILGSLPRERVLAETDHPFGDRHGVHPRQPGQVDIVEAALAEHWKEDVESVRRQVWRNLLDIAERTGTAMLFPATFQKSMLSA